MPDPLIINGRFLTKSTTGVQRYALELLNKFDLLLNEEAYRHLKITCLVPQERRFQPQWKKIDVLEVGLNRGNIWEQVDLPFHAKGRFLFSPANIGPFYYSNQAITFHDASVFAMPEAYSVAFRIKYWFIFKNLVRTARLILTDSVFSQKELSSYLGVPGHRIKIILLGGDHLNGTMPDFTILQKHGLKKASYLLTVASQSLHKNFGLVLQAAQALGAATVFAAAGGSFKNVFQRTELQNIPSNVRLLGYIDDHELKALYENALGFVIPSLYEGFGLPVLEAMNSGCPVLSSNAASLPEVGGEAALYFDPRDVNSLTMAIRTFLSDSAIQGKLRFKGLAHAGNYTWEKTARTTLTTLQNYL